jgi:hypothetical protein
VGWLIGLDQFLGAWVPGAEIDRTISHRLGVKRVKVALRSGIVENYEVMSKDGDYHPWPTMASGVQRRLAEVRIPFWRYPLPALIDYFLDRIDRNHSLKSIGF